LNCKIAVVGAGSLAFTPNLMADLARSATFEGSSITLMDIDAEVLGKVKRIAERIVESRKAELKVDATTDHEEALKDADFVTITIGVGASKPPNLTESLRKNTACISRGLILSVQAVSQDV